MLRALGYGTDAELLDLLGEEPKLLASAIRTQQRAQKVCLRYINAYAQVNHLTEESATTLINNLFSIQEDMIYLCEALQVSTSCHLQTVYTIILLLKI